MLFTQPKPNTAVFNYNVDLSDLSDSSIDPSDSSIDPSDSSIDPSELRVVVFDDPRDRHGKRIGLPEIVEFVKLCTNLAVLAIRSPTHDYSMLFGCDVINILDQLWLGVAPSIATIEYHSIGRSFFAHNVSDVGFDRLPNFYHFVRLSNILALNPEKVVRFVKTLDELRSFEYGYMDMDSFVNCSAIGDDTTVREVCDRMAGRDAIYDLVDVISPTICCLKFVGCDIPGGVFWDLRGCRDLRNISIMYSWIDWDDLDLDGNETLELCFVNADDLMDTRFNSSATLEIYEFPGWI